MAESKPPGPWYKRVLTFLRFDIIRLMYYALVALKVEISKGPPTLNVEQIGKRSGHVAVMTGGPRGIAAEIVKRLLQLDYTVIMGVRNIQESRKRLIEIVQKNPELSIDNVKFYEMDLMSLNSIQKFAKEVLQNVTRIDLLLCNAANMNEPYVLTVDGYESQFQVNFLSNFLLIQLLSNKLKETSVRKESPCQIIYTSSVLYEAGKLHFHELAKPQVYTSYKFYFTSKLCQVASMLALERKFKEEEVNVHCYCIHPGVIPTDLWYTAGGWIVAKIGRILQGILRTRENGADTILWPAFVPEFQQSGGIFMVNGTSRKIIPEASNVEKQNKLYEISIKLIRKQIP